MKVEEKDPRVPFSSILGLERAETIVRQTNEVVDAMVTAQPNLFVEMAADLDNEINANIASFDKKINKAEKSSVETKKALDDGKIKRHEAKEQLETIAKDLVLLNLQKTYEESRRRTPEQLDAQKRGEIIAEAIVVLMKIHDKQMAGRLAQWQTTCRVDGCTKQPYKNPRLGGVGLKTHRRTHVFCHGHAGMKNRIPKSVYRTLKANKNLRVVA
jgi:hypothetical protein